MTVRPRKVLVPVDGSGNAERAVDLVVEYASSGLIGEVHLLTVQYPVSGSVATFAGRRAVKGYYHDEGMKLLAPATEKLKATGIPVHIHIGVGDPGEEIAGFCEELGCDNIVMGTRGLGSAAELLLGSVASDVIERTKVPVTLVK